MLIAGAVLLSVIAGLVLYLRNVSETSSSGDTITQEQARELARKECCGFPNTKDFVLNDVATTEHNFGWVFYYATKKYLETKDPRDSIPGTAPIIVKKDGSVVRLSSSSDPQQQIAQYERGYEVIK